MQSPQEIGFEEFVALMKKNDEEKCHRSARSLQAAWRGWVSRNTPFECDRCGEHDGRRRHSPNVCLCAGCPS